MNLKRKGKVSVSSEILNEGSFYMLKQAFQDLIVIDCKRTDTHINYTCLSPLFDEVEASDTIPTYYLIITSYNSDKQGGYYTSELKKIDDFNKELCTFRRESVESFNKRMGFTSDTAKRIKDITNGITN